MLEYLAIKMTITRKEIEELLEISSSKANKLLKKLVEDKLIIKTGTNRGTRYSLNKK